MRAYLLRKTGPAGSLVLEEVPDPQPGPDEVLVRIRTIGINYAEIQSRKGLYGWAPKRPYIPGMESYGEIRALGSRVQDRKIGEPVIVAAQHGNYAEQIAIPARQALPAAPDFSKEENAAFAVNFMTAWVALHRLMQIQSGESVLIQAAAGGVGTAAVQIAKVAGARVIGTVGSDEKMELVLRLGAEAVINYRKRDFAKEIRKQFGSEGLDGVLEVVGGKVFRKSLGLLKPFGRMALMGFASLNLKRWNPVSWFQTWRAIPRVNFSALAQSSRMVGASHLGYLLDHPTLLPILWGELLEAVRVHGLRPIVGQAFPFEELTAAHRFMESRQSQGKIVLKIEGD